MFKLYDGRRIDLGWAADMMDRCSYYWTKDFGWVLCLDCNRSVEAYELGELTRAIAEHLEEEGEDPDMIRLEVTAPSLELSEEANLYLGIDIKLPKASAGRKEVRNPLETFRWSGMENCLALTAADDVEIDLEWLSQVVSLIKVGAERAPCDVELKVKGMVSNIENCSFPANVDIHSPSWTWQYNYDEDSLSIYSNQSITISYDDFGAVNLTELVEHCAVNRIHKLTVQVRSFEWLPSSPEEEDVEPLKIHLDLHLRATSATPTILKVPLRVYGTLLLEAEMGPIEVRAPLQAFGAGRIQLKAPENTITNYCRRNVWMWPAPENQDENENNKRNGTSGAKKEEAPVFSSDKRMSLTAKKLENKVMPMFATEAGEEVFASISDSDMAVFLSRCSVCQWTAKEPKRFELEIEIRESFNLAVVGELTLLISRLCCSSASDVAASVCIRTTGCCDFPNNATVSLDLPVVITKIDHQSGPLFPFGSVEKLDCAVDKTINTSTLTVTLTAMPNAAIDMSRAYDALQKLKIAPNLSSGVYPVFSRRLKLVTDHLPFGLDFGHEITVVLPKCTVEFAKTCQIVVDYTLKHAEIDDSTACWLQEMAAANSDQLFEVVVKAASIKVALINKQSRILNFRTKWIASGCDGIHIASPLEVPWITCEATKGPIILGHRIDTEVLDLECKNSTLVDTCHAANLTHQDRRVFIAAQKVEADVAGFTATLKLFDLQSLQLPLLQNCSYCRWVKERNSSFKLLLKTNTWVELSDVARLTRHISQQAGRHSALMHIDIAAPRWGFAKRTTPEGFHCSFSLLKQSGPREEDQSDDWDWCDSFAVTKERDGMITVDVRSFDNEIVCLEMINRISRPLFESHQHCSLNIDTLQMQNVGKLCCLGDVYLSSLAYNVRWTLDAAKNERTFTIYRIRMIDLDEVPFLLTDIAENNAINLINRVVFEANEVVKWKPRSETALCFISLHRLNITVQLRTALGEATLTKFTGESDCLRWEGPAAAIASLTTPINLLSPSSTPSTSTA